MNIVHLSITPLAGSPINISKSIDQYTYCSSRHIVLKPNAYNTRTFPIDLIWDEHNDICLDLLSKANIIHCHHPFHVRKSPFGDLFEHCSSDALYVRQFHSAPSAFSNSSLEDINDNPLPSLVNAQHPERYFPDSRLVPNIVRIDEPIFQVQSNQKLDVISFSPTTDQSAWFTEVPENRWDTKGRPETEELLKTICPSDDSFSYDLIERIPWEQCIARRAASSIAIDEIVTGSYHLSSLECMALGLPVFSYLDERIIDVIRDVTGATHLPWINSHLENVYYLLNEFIHDKELRNQTGDFSGQWVAKYWHPSMMVSHYIDAYENMVSTGETINQRRFGDDQQANWTTKQMHDLLFTARLARHKSGLLQH